MIKHCIISCTVLMMSILIQFGSHAYCETIIAFGDSLTEGCGPVEEVYYDSDCGWIGRSDAYPYFLESYYTNDGRAIVVRNFGMGGETTASGLNRLDTFMVNS